MDTQNVEKIFKYYEDYGNRDYIGEDISQISHMIQAAMLAESDNESVEMILACFFHDIGHLVAFDMEKMGDYGVKNHEKIGAEFLRTNGINGLIPDLVENHVSAKRYLVYSCPNYFNKLSEASKNTLTYQGNSFSPEEASEYEKHPNFDKYVKIRIYDDNAKVKDAKLNSLDYYKDMLKNYFLLH